MAAAVAAHALLRALVDVHARAAVRRGPVARLAHALERALAVHAPPALHTTRHTTFTFLLPKQTISIENRNFF